MKDNEIIKALECCQTEYARNCKECPYERYKTHYISATTCSSQMRKDLLDLIKRQKSEGEWGFDGMSWTCSECGEYAAKGIKTNFCPNCGARMKGGAE